MLSIIIPAYNEEKTIKRILKRVFAVDINKEVLVINDCSKDSTLSILKSINNPDLKIFSMPENKGKGAAVRYGIKKTIGDYIIIQDADLEYDPYDYKKLMAPLINNEAEAVYGNRFPLGGKNMFLKQRAANKFLTIFTNILYGGGVADMETCYKVIPAELLKSLKLKENNFDIEAEITAKLLKKKKRVKNIPVNYMGRSYLEGKKICFKDFISAIRILLKYRFFEYM